MQVFCTKVYFRLMSAIPFVFCIKYLQINILRLKIFYFKIKRVLEFITQENSNGSFLVTILSFSTFSVVLFVHSSIVMKHQKGYTYMIDFTNTLFQSVKQKIWGLMGRIFLFVCCFWFVCLFCFVCLFVCFFVFFLFFVVVVVVVVVFVFVFVFEGYG